MRFIAKLGIHEVAMDTKSPIGSDSAASPKQLVLAGICGCTAMDVVGLLRKNKQQLESLEIEADAPTATDYPTVFTHVTLKYKLRGELDPKVVEEAVWLSMTKYCSVSAMIAKAAPIGYEIEVNGKPAGKGEAKFQ